MKASQDSIWDGKTEQNRNRNKKGCCNVRGGYHTNRCVYL